MIINPIIPLWLMGIICIILLFFKRKGLFNYIRQILIVFLMFVINMRIMILADDVTNMTSNVDIMFVIDNTISMLAEDYNGDEKRLDAVKEDCKYIIEKFAGASYSLIVFDNNVQRMLPYTIDTEMVIHAIDLLEGQSQFYATGTSLNHVMAEMDKMLDNNRDTYKILFFISDGEVINSDELKSYGELGKYVDNGAVLGYGTDKGGVMRPVQFAGDSDTADILYYYDENDNWVQAISKIDEKNLKQIAKNFGVSYVHATDRKAVNKQVEKIIDKLGQNGEFKMGDGSKGYKETYYYFVFILMGILIYDFIYYRKKG